MNKPRSLAIVASLSGAFCLSAGLSYLTVSPTELTISALVALGVVGFIALVGSGLWQAHVDAANRRLPLFVLGLVGSGLAIGSVLGFLGAQVARENRLEPTALPSTLHVAGVVMGLVLCALVFVELGRMDSLGASVARRGRSRSVS